MQSNPNNTKTYCFKHRDAVQSKKLIIIRCKYFLWLYDIQMLMLSYLTTVAYYRKNMKQS